MATTTQRDDYLGRDLVTPDSNSKDHLGRVTTSTVDHLGRSMVRTMRPTSTAVSVGQLLQFTGGQKFIVTIAGTTAASQPAVPAIGATVADGGATLLRTR